MSGIGAPVLVYSLCVADVNMSIERLGSGALRCFFAGECYDRLLFANMYVRIAM